MSVFLCIVYCILLDLSAQEWCPNHKCLNFIHFFDTKGGAKDFNPDKVVDAYSNLLHFEDPSALLPAGFLRFGLVEKLMKAADMETMGFGWGLALECLYFKKGLLQAPKLAVFDSNTLKPKISEEVRKITIRMAVPKVDRSKNPCHAFVDDIAAELAQREPQKKPEPGNSVKEGQGNSVPANEKVVAEVPGGPAGSHEGQQTERRLRQRAC